MDQEKERAIRSTFQKRYPNDTRQLSSSHVGLWLGEKGRASTRFDKYMLKKCRFEGVEA